MTIDYRELLKKYIEHVSNEEGFDYINERHKDLELFTEEEWEALYKLSCE
jgi:hypothetical protein